MMSKKIYEGSYRRFVFASHQDSDVILSLGM
ncbi:MAG: hypothetical protein ACI9FB_004536 [Candidatus Azotimanducaceae bacterium]|jgi:hypothetical protein